MPRPTASTLLLLPILLAALALRCWGLDAQGWGAEYYSAAAFSMSLNAHNFFFAAFDPAGFISVDKPPLALWLQALSVMLIGFSPWAVLLPQALMGTLSVWVLYRMVQPRFGAHAALLAALLLALTPIWVAVNRTNNMDTALSLLLMLAAWSLMHALETGSKRWWWAAMAIVGLAFNVKMLAAFVLLPAFFLIFLRWGPGRPGQRLVQALVGAGVLLAFSLPWVLAVQSTPAAQRPWIGGSPGNDLVELILGHNARNRFALERRARGLASGQVPMAEAASKADDRSETEGRTGTSPDKPATTREWIRSYFSRTLLRTPAGPTRLFQDKLPAQFAWWLPLSLAGLLGLWRWQGAAVRLDLSTARMRQRTEPWILSAWSWMWGLWLLSDWLLYSALGGIIHYYYLATLAPPLAAGAGIALARVFQHGTGGASRLLWPALLIVTALWQLHVQSAGLALRLGDLLAQLEGEQGRAPLLMLVLAAIALLPSLMPARSTEDGPPVWQRLAPAVASLAFLVMPLAWALSPIKGPVSGLIPSADLYLSTHLKDQARALSVIRDLQTPPVTRLADYLKAQQGGATFLLSTSTTQLAAPLIIRTGLPVQARGGFHGLDRAVSVQQMAAAVAAGQLRFVMLGDVATVSQRLGADEAGREISEWVREKGQPVDPALWREAGTPQRWALFDMKP